MWKKKNSPVNIRFVAKTSDIRNFSQNSVLTLNHPFSGNIFYAKILPFFEIPVVSIHKTIHFGLFFIEYPILERNYSSTAHDLYPSHMGLR